MIILISFPSIKSVATTRTANPAKAYSIAKCAINDNKVVNLTFWTECDVENLLIPYNYICNSIDSLNFAMERITLSMTRQREVQSIGQGGDNNA